MIKLEKICKSYGEKVIFDNFELCLKGAGLVLISGNSGAGKTTLLKLISGLEKADGGKVTADGNISYLFQEDRLFSQLNAAQNINVIKSKKCAYTTDELLKKVGLENCGRMKISQMSGGMCRRLAFARAICADFDILLLDEPFNGLDKNSIFLISSIIEDISNSHLVLVVSHIKDGIFKKEYSEIKIN